jgi:hypothetical protein
MTPQISLAHLARPGASRIIVPFFSATASRLEPPRPAAAAVRATRSTVPGETLHTGADLLTDKQAARLTALFAIDEHVEVEATWGIYQRMIAAYRQPDPAAGRELMVKLIESLSAGVPRPLVEVAKLGRTLSKRAADVVAYYFDRPCTSNGPTEAIYELAGGWSGTGWSGWFRSRCLVCDSRSNWPVSAVSSG